MTSVFILIFVSIITEALTEWVKTAIPSIADQTKIIYPITAVFGIFIAVCTGADIFAVVGVACTVPYAGIVTTGILCSRGSNYIYDIMSKITTSKKDSKQFEKDEVSESDKKEAQG